VGHGQAYYVLAVLANPEPARNRRRQSVPDGVGPQHESDDSHGFGEIVSVGKFFTKNSSPRTVDEEHLGFRWTCVPEGMVKAPVNAAIMRPGEVLSNGDTSIWKRRRYPGIRNFCQVCATRLRAQVKSTISLVTFRYGCCLFRSAGQDQDAHKLPSLLVPTVMPPVHLRSLFSPRDFAPHLL
jgi:hypothetical protein